MSFLLAQCRMLMTAVILIALLYRFIRRKLISVIFLSRTLRCCNLKAPIGVRVERFFLFVQCRMSMTAGILILAKTGVLVFSTRFFSSVI